MQLTKQQKILCGVLALGLGALAMDRFVLGAPQSAAASEAELAAPADAAPAPSPTAPAMTATLPTAPLAATTAGDQGLPTFTALTERLAKLPAQPAQTSQASQADALQQTDPFSLPKDWQQGTEQAALTGVQKEDQSAKDFLKKHRLDGTFRTDTEQRAVVDGYAMSRDQVLDGYKLVEIAERWVIWRAVATDQPVVMHAPEP